MRRVKVPWLAFAAVLAIGVLWSHYRRPVEPKVAIHEAIAQFIEGMESRKINNSVHILAPEFRYNTYTRADVSRGLFLMNRDYDRLNVYVAGEDIQVEPSGDRATALVQVSLSGWSHGREVTAGMDKPVEVTAVFERRGRRWLCTQASSDNRIEGMVD